VNLAKIAMKLKPKGAPFASSPAARRRRTINERMKGIRDVIAGKVSNTPPPGDRLTGQNGWKEVDGCPLYTNDDFPLSVKQLGEILAKYPTSAAFVPTGGFPQFVPQAYRQVVEKNMDRIKSKEDHPRSGRYAAPADGPAEGRVQPWPGRPAPVRHGLQGDEHPEGPQGEEERSPIRSTPAWTSASRKPRQPASPSNRELRHQAAPQTRWPFFFPLNQIIHRKGRKGRKGREGKTRTGKATGVKSGVAAQGTMPPTFIAMSRKPMKRFLHENIFCSCLSFASLASFA